VCTGLAVAVHTVVEAVDHIVAAVAVHIVVVDRTVEVVACCTVLVEAVHTAVGHIAVEVVHIVAAVVCHTDFVVHEVADRIVGGRNLVVEFHKDSCLEVTVSVPCPIKPTCNAGAPNRFTKRN
jgi:5-formaminoimidazole-4-carboxamide-1-beta-D-ribofuranosyl 5'-monophosphate synthetase